jgi:uncharacterized protein
MGHCDTSARFGGDGSFRAADGGTAEAVAAGVEGGARSLASWALLGLVRVYILFFSPILGGACKFYPSCSNYAYEAVSRHGARRGTILALKRLLRCRPLTKGGFDPVPDNFGEELLPGLKPSQISQLDGTSETLPISPSQPSGFMPVAPGERAHTVERKQ